MRLEGLRIDNSRTTSLFVIQSLKSLEHVKVGVAKKPEHSQDEDNIVPYIIILNLPPDNTPSGGSCDCFPQCSVIDKSRY